MLLREHDIQFDVPPDLLKLPLIVAALRESIGIKTSEVESAITRDVSLSVVARPSQWGCLVALLYDFQVPGSRNLLSVFNPLFVKPMVDKPIDCTDR